MNIVCNNRGESFLLAAVEVGHCLGPALEKGSNWTLVKQTIVSPLGNVAFESGLSIYVECRYILLKSVKVLQIKVLFRSPQKRMNFLFPTLSL